MKLTLSAIRLCSVQWMKGKLIMIWEEDEVVSDICREELKKTKKRLTHDGWTAGLDSNQAHIDYRLRFYR
jgi:hypothetical protein